MGSEVRLGVIGDYNPSNETHRATDDALTHSADALGAAVRVEWIPTPIRGHGAVPLQFRPQCQVSAVLLKQSAQDCWG